MTTPVRPQLARLLKEKGCEIATTDLYIDNELIYAEGRICNWNLEPEYEELENPISAPTIAQVVMWLYKKHDIWIEVRKTNFFKEIRFQSYMNENPLVGNLGGYISHSQPTQAYEAAIEYCLTNLI